MIAGHGSFGQIKVTDTLVAPKGTKYIVSKDPNNNRGRFYSNSKNKFDNYRPKVSADILHYGGTYMDTGVEEQKRRNLLLVQAFKAANRSIPLNDTLFMFCKVQPNGEILEMNFYLKANSKLSTEDVELVEETMKRKFKFKMEYDKYKDMEYLTFTWPLHFADVKKLAE